MQHLVEVMDRVQMVALVNGEATVL
ncbi:hypothetical protein LCGC14_2287950, partial [marine sediment metagenome]